MNFFSYEQLIERLYTLSRGKSTLDLTNMHALHAALGQPAKHLRTVHIAGTNGKGSVTTKIAHTLALSGYRVGCYTSPHISSFRERICINGRPASKETICQYLPAVFNKIDQLNIPSSFFEVTTALAFLIFLEEKVDVAVIETGLGGRLDATNVITPELSVITSISLDHTALLGSSLEEIAREKGGIIKKQVPLVLGPHANLPVLHEMARKLEAPVHVCSVVDEDYDAENSAIAKLALTVLQAKWNLSQEACTGGLKKRPACRIEEIPLTTLKKSPLLAKLFSLPKHIVLDVAHNPDGVRRLLKALEKRFPSEKIYLLCGFSEDKDVTPMLKQLLDVSCGVVAAAASMERAMKVESLVDLARKLSPHQSIEGRALLSDALYLAATQAAEAEALLLICGTFFIMAELRAALGICEERDLTPLHERVNKKT